MIRNPTGPLAVALALLLAGSSLAVEQVLTVHYVDGLPQLTVSDGTDFRAARRIATALKSEGYTHLNVTVTPSGLPDQESETWIHVAIDWSRGRQHGVSVCFSPNTSFEIIAALAEAFENDNGDKTHFISKSTFDAIVAANKASAAPAATTAAANASATTAATAPPATSGPYASGPYADGALPSAVIVASEPTVNSIDYSNPDAYLAIPETLGNAQAIAERASTLKGNDDRATVRNVLEWMDANLSYDANKAYEWRNYDTVVEQGCYGGCADQAIVCGALMKAAGVPTVWVKTMDVSWIWDLKKGRSFKSWSGHVFLEVYLDDQWVLLDPGAKQIYQNYSTESRILPGNRFAYHKGNDPQQMIMSLQWEPWKEQTKSYFSQLDVLLLPVDIKDVAFVGVEAYIIGNNPHYKTLSELARLRGWTVRYSFNSDYDNLLPLTRGHVLLIETQRGVPIVPLDVLERVHPGAAKGLKANDGVVRIGRTTIAFVDCSESDGGKPPQLPLFDP